MVARVEMPWMRKIDYLNIYEYKCNASITINSIYQNPVVKLNSGRIFKKVFECGGEGKQIIRDPSVSHLGERVINQSSIQTSYKSTWNKRFICTLKRLLINKIGWWLADIPYKIVFYLREQLKMSVHQFPWQTFWATEDSWSLPAEKVKCYYFIHK